MAKSTGTDAHRDRILNTALQLLTKEGRDAVTTRNVAEAAKVQPPVLYRIFGDKTGLLDAVAAYGFAAFTAKKQPPDGNGNPVEAIRSGWDLHVDFGLSNPELYLLMYANPRPGVLSVGAQQSFAMLHAHMQRVAAAGRLRVSVPKACALYHAAAVGVVMSLLATAQDTRDISLSSTARDQALNAITTDSPDVPAPRMAIAANQLRALLAQTGHDINVLTGAERSLLSEWLLRLSDGGE